MEPGPGDSVFAEEDKGDLVFSDDVKDPAVIRAFLEAAGDVNYEPIPEEGEGPYPKEIVRRWFHHKQRIMYDLTLLHWAAWYNVLETVKVLIQYGAKVDIKDYKGKTPLDLAKARKADKAVIDLLSVPTNRRASLRV